MTATIKWASPRTGTQLQIDMPSRFIETMSRAFGDDRRWVLLPRDTDTLNGIVAASESNAEAFEEIIRLIAQTGEIEVWAE